MYFGRGMTRLAFHGCSLLVRPCRLLGTGDPVWKVRPAVPEGETTPAHSSASYANLDDLTGSRPGRYMVHGEHYVVVFITRFALSPFLSFWLTSLSTFFLPFSFSLLLGGELATWPGHGINRLCSTNWFRAKSKRSLARQPRRGWARPVPRSDAQAASLKSSPRRFKRPEWSGYRMRNHLPRRARDQLRLHSCDGRP